MPNQNPNGTGNLFAFNLRFRGQYADIETGTFYNYFRDYDPSIGRYLQSDPIGLIGESFSTYVYADGNSLSVTDAYGLKWTKEQCAKFRADIMRKFGLLINELRKYDPVEDGKGGHPMKWGSGTTSPGGHYTEITNLQKGLKNDLADYIENCIKDNDDDNPSIPRDVDKACNQFVPPPTLMMPELPEIKSPMSASTTESGEAGLFALILMMLALDASTSSQ